MGGSTLHFANKPKERERIAKFAAAIGTKPAVLGAFLPGVADVCLAMTESEITEHARADYR